MGYVLITFFVLLFLNIYCSSASNELFYQNKKTAMLEKCQLAADEISQLDILNTQSIGEVLETLRSRSDPSDPADTIKTSRIIVADPVGHVIFDSTETNNGSYCLFPEIITALRGNDVFSWQYRDGIMQSQCAIPIIYYGNTVGCVYMMEHDTQQGQLLQHLQLNVLQITLILELFVILFSLAFSKTFSKRLEKIMQSMRIIREGDYTHKVQMGGNDELTALGEEFNDLTERLQTSEQKRRRFVSDASHELKTPLASIKLLTDSILHNEMDTDTIREFVGDIGDEAERLNRMTAKLLSLTKVDGELMEESEIIYMTPTIQRAVRRLSVIADQAGIDIHLHLAEDTPVLIIEDDLYQVVYNLIENGIKYNSWGGSLTLRIRREEDNAILEVSDTGMGIPEDALPHIFERFYRVDKARSRASGGSGLGLSIVRSIVQRNRGEIAVSSELGKGTTFTVTFPAFDTEVDKA